MKTFLIFLLLISCTVPEKSVTVYHVIDGDTFQLSDGTFVRLIGIDAPERRKEGYLEATLFLEAMISNKHVRLEKDITEKDSFGRLLRYVYLNETFVNAAVVRAGLAAAKSYEPDITYQSILEAAEAEARHAKRGIWAETFK